MNSTFLDNTIYSIPEGKPRGIDLTEKKVLLVLLRKSDYEAHTDLLHNVLKAIAFTKDENAIIYTMNEGEESIALAKLAVPPIDAVICFGLKPKQISMNAGFRANKFYQTETFRILLSHSLEQLEGNKKFKMALWTALQEAFKKS